MLLSMAVLSAYLIQRWLNEYVTDRYMDEYFHIKMTEQYIVHKNFSTYDGGITTPPGLYYLGMLYGWGL